MILRARAWLLLIAALACACSQPYRGPRQLAAVSAGLLAGGGATWAVADRTGNGRLAAAGLGTAVVGVALALAAGGWLATQVACEADYQCPENETCREITAPPGATPYKQCMRRDSAGR